MKNVKDIVTIVKSRRDVMWVEERMPIQPKSRRDVIWVETPTMICVILRYGLTFGFVQYPYHVPTGLWKVGNAFLPTLYPRRDRFSRLLREHVIGRYEAIPR